jgi:MoaA/NifB/PqqE/SkfB family radical SAM enzyme
LVQVSIDAAEPETYANVRRGGDFKRLMRNLEFLAELRKVGKIKRFDLLFVVQTINYLEMPDFIRLGKRLGVDSVQFMLIDHWERGLSYEEYVESKIWDKRHRHYADLIQLLRDPIFDDPIVHLDSVQALREDWQPPEIQIDAETGEHRRSA